MAEFRMWGPEQAGERIAELDRVKMNLDNMRALQLAGEVQMQPGKAEAQAAQTRLHNAQAGEAEFKLDATRKWSQAISGAGEGRDALAQMEFIGTEAIKSGLPKMGGDILNQVALSRQRAATESLRLSQATRQEVLTIRDQALMRGNLASTVVDQATLDSARLTAQGMGLDVSEIPLDYPSAAPIIQQMKQMAIGAKGQAELQLREIDQQDQRRTRADTRDTNALRREKLRVDMDLARQREARLAKAGGKVVASPSRDDVAATRALLEQVGLKLDSEEAKIASRAIAAEAKAMTITIPGLDIDQATRRAIAKAQERGDFQTIPSWRDWVPGVGSRSKFAPGGAAGKTPQAPIAVVPPRAEMVENRYYQTPKGVLRWSGGKFVRPPQGLVGPVSIGGEDDEDE